MESKDIYIIGAGTYGETMYELAELLGYLVKGYYDEDENKIDKDIMGTKVISKFDDLTEGEVKGKNFIVAIGDNRIRAMIMSRINSMGGHTPSLIHPTAIVSPSSEIGNGVYIQAGAYIWTKVKIGDFCIISPYTVIAHHTSLGEACLISSRAGVGASINIGKNVFVGIGATIITGVSTICDNVIVGAGAVVIRNIEPNTVYAGVPARKIKDYN